MIINKSTYIYILTKPIVINHINKRSMATLVFLSSQIQGTYLTIPPKVTMSTRFMSKWKALSNMIKNALVSKVPEVAALAKKVKEPKLLESAAHSDQIFKALKILQGSTLPVPLKYSPKWFSYSGVIPINQEQISTNTSVPVSEETTINNSVECTSVDNIIESKNTMQNYSIVTSTEKKQIKNLSGLLDPQEEWKSKITQDLHPSVKPYLFIMYSKALYVFVHHKIQTYEDFLIHIDEFFKTCPAIFRTLDDNKLFAHRYFSTLQHIIIALLGDINVDIKIFKECHWFNALNFDMYVNGNALLAIESYVLSQTTKNSDYSFVMINPEVPTLKKLPFTIKQSQILTGQQNCDALGISATFDPEFAMTYIYADVKMQFAGLLRGHFSFKPELFTNKRSLSEYLTAVESAFPQIIERREKDEIILYKDNTGVVQEISLLKIGKNHPIYQFAKSITIECKKIRKAINEYAFDKSTKDFKEKKDIQNIIELVEKLHVIIRSMMNNKEISNLFSIGLSTDPGLDTIFLDFFSLHLRKTMQEAPDKILAIDYKVLLSSSFDKEIHRAELKKIIEIFPKDVVEEFRAALKAIDNLS